MSTTKDELRAKIAKAMVDAHQSGHWACEETECHKDGSPINHILNLLEGEKQKLAKAYGGCTLCYGKGYATGAEFWRGRGKTWGRPNKIKYCTCDRGKQLATLNKEPKKGKE